MRKFICLTIVFFIVAQLLAQQGINKGKIYTKNAVLDGYISISVYEQTPQEFKFSSSQQGPFSLIDNNQILKVEYADGVTFEKYFIKIPIINKDYLQRIKEDYDPAQFFSGDAFLERKLAGAVSFYQLTDYNGYAHFFYRSNTDTGITYLPYNTYVEDGAIQYDNSFKNIVSYLLTTSGCTKNIGEIDNLLYQFGPLLRIFRKINGCLGSSTVDYAKQNRVKLTASIVAGVVGNYVQPVTVFDNKWKRVIEPKLGLFIGIAPKHNLKSYVVGLEITTDNYSARSDSIVQSNGRRGREYYSIMALHFSPMLRFFLSSDKQPTFAELGMTFSNVFNSKLKYEYVYNGIPGKAESEGINNKLFHMFFLGLGVELNKVSLQARYCTSFSTDNKDNYFGIIGKYSLF